MDAANDATARLGAPEVETPAEPAPARAPASSVGMARPAPVAVKQGMPGAGRWSGRSLRRWAARPRALTVEEALWLFVLAGAAALRLLSLDGVPLTQAEGTRALQSLGAAQLRSGGFSAWPGELTDAATAVIFKLFGAGDAAARVAPAIAGVLLVASFWLLRSYLGRGATFAAAVLATVSPVFVVAARSSGGQSLGAALAILLVALTLRCVERPTTRRVAVIAALAVFGLGTDALYLGLIVPFAGWLVARGAWAPDPAVLGAWARVRRWRIWLPSAAPLCLAALLLTVSRFGFGFERLQTGATADWALAFKALPQSPPWHYLFDVLVGYELPLLLIGAAGCWLVVRRRLWQRLPIAGLLVVWLVSGALLDLLMQARQPSTLLLTALPLALLGGLAVNHLVYSFVEGTPEAIDALFAVGLLAALTFCLISANLSAQLALFGDVGRIWFGLMLAAVCLAGAIYRARVDGAGTAVLSCAALGVAALVFNLHGAGSVAFGTGDEFLTGQRTTREGVALARLLVKNGGGVSTVTDDSLLPLAWYLRDTVRSGGNAENARLIPAGTKPPAGFAVSGNPATVSVRWAPRSWSSHGMVRWWVFREAWGPHDDVSVQLIVAQ
ncbi:MAG TPA: glycosyltransferase family 39 protein [Dehalococcoidia bacterium]|nr:glycosyltransferase family 39 protein [Dehalococcoidia bacterium]